MYQLLPFVRSQLSRSCSSAYRKSTSIIPSRGTSHISNTEIHYARHSSIILLTTRPLLRIFCRNNSTAKNNVFENHQGNVNRDVKVYSYQNDRLFRWITLFGMVQLLFWANFSYFCCSGIEGLEAVLKRSNSGRGEEGFWGYLMDFQSRNRNKIAAACMTLGLVVFGFSIIYPLRMVTALTLLKGGQAVSLGTYSHFGRMQQSIVPLSDISCRHSRAARGPQVTMKVRGRWFYYMLDKRDGKFLEPKIFDYVIGLNRFTK